MYNYFKKAYINIQISASKQMSKKLLCIIAFRTSVISPFLHLPLSLSAAFALSIPHQRKRKETCRHCGRITKQEKRCVCVCVCVCQKEQGEHSVGDWDGTQELQGLVCSYFKHTDTHTHTRMVNCSVITECYL